MRVASLELRNIRSYKKESIRFTTGTTLLTGDIGSGKSTILLALEFALFGIQRGELSGNALLRHGARDGSVTLQVVVNGEHVTIKRSLKRKSNGVGQENGELTINGETTQLTAVELKARVLTLLNYPHSLLSKGKSLLFRYTVYTPQEEMKNILYEKADDRLETLRKLFNIDKYKRVREHAMLVLRELHKEESITQTRIEELAKTIAGTANVAGTLAEKKRILSEKQERAKEYAEKAKTARTALEKLEAARFAKAEAVKQHAVAKTRVESTKQRLQEVTEEKARLDDLVRQTEAHLPQESVDDKALTERARVLDEHEAKLASKEREVLAQETRFKDAIKRSEALVNEIGALDDCPTCHQRVDERHKEKIRVEEERKMQTTRTQLAQLSTVKTILAEKKAKAMTERVKLQEQRELLSANKVKLHNLFEQKAKVKVLAETIEKLKVAVTEAVGDVERHAKKMASFSGDEEAYKEQKVLVDRARSAAEESRLVVARLEKEVEGLAREAKRVAETTAQKRTYEENLRVTRKQVDWTSKHVLGVAHAVEKALFTNAYCLFNESFTQWFTTLLEDENLSARLDAEFTPVLTQDGYETSIAYLSGGEKTAVALAYRLALNRVVNEFLTGVHTRGLLILDEPTDGFSSEQLDRVREVLDQLQLEQVLIVSHEAQMEGYVDHVRRVYKEGHESKILS